MITLPKADSDLLILPASYNSNNLVGKNYQTVLIRLQITFAKKRILKSKTLIYLAENDTNRKLYLCHLYIAHTK